MKLLRTQQHNILIISLLLLAFEVQAQHIKTKRIWKEAPHSAFTSLIFFDGNYYCAFREANTHVDKNGNDNGVIRILKSANTKKWKTFDLVQKEGFDLRDPMLSITPEGKIMLLMGASVHKNNITTSICSHIAFASPNSIFDFPQPITTDYEANRKWLWKIIWYKNIAYGFVYGDSFRLLSSLDGVHYQTVKEFDIQGSPNETDLCFEKNGQLTAMIRRAKNYQGLTAISEAPYKDWQFKECGYELGGPDIILIENGKKLITSRFISTKGNKTVLFELKKDNLLYPILTLPSGGDCSYADAILQSDTLYISYYSNHIIKASIYLATIPKKIWNKINEK